MLRRALSHAAARAAPAALECRVALAPSAVSPPGAAALVWRLSAGPRAEPRDAPGAAAALRHLLLLGNESQSATALFRGAEAAGVRLDVRGDHECVELRARCAQDAAPHALRLLVGALGGLPPVGARIGRHTAQALQRALATEAEVVARYAPAEALWDAAFAGAYAGALGWPRAASLLCDADGLAAHVRGALTRPSVLAFAGVSRAAVEGALRAGPQGSSSSDWPPLDGADIGERARVAFHIAHAWTPARDKAPAPVPGAVERIRTAHSHYDALVCLPTRGRADAEEHAAARLLVRALPGGSLRAYADCGLAGFLLCAPDEDALGRAIAGVAQRIAGLAPADVEAAQRSADMDAACDDAADWAERALADATAPDAPPERGAAVSRSVLRRITSQRPVFVVRGRDPHRVALPGA